MSVEERVSRLYLEHQDMLLEYIRAMVHNYQDAEDILQETGLIILSRATVPDNPDIFPAWARGVARNIVMHFWRARQRARVIPDSRLLEVVDQAFEEADTESDLMINRRKALAECLQLVQGSALNILRLRYLQGLTCEKVAAVVSKTTVAVRVILMRTRDSLAACIASRLTKEVI